MSGDQTESTKPTPILSQNAYAGNSSNPLVERRMQVQGAATMLFYSEPLTITEGKGVYLYDDQGRAYLDMYNNVASIGHAHPFVIEAVRKQMEKVNIHSRYLHESFIEYANALFATFENPLTHCNFLMTCTGSEANDLALRLALHGTGKSGVIVSRAAYHGNTALSSAASPSALREGEQPDNIATFDIDAILNSFNESLDDTENLNSRIQSELNLAMAQLNAKGYGCGAILLDSIFSSDGVFPGPKGFLKKAIEHLQSQGVIYIADEVQPGFARTGHHFWGFEHHGLTPDIITMGKPMGNGYPCAGLISRSDLLSEFCKKEGYFNTFGGSTVAVAAAQAVLDVIDIEALQENAKKIGDELKSEIVSLSKKFEAISDVRGSGLFLGVDIENASQVVNSMRDKGVLLGVTGLTGNTLKIRPPLCFSREHVDLFLTAFESVLKA